MATSFQDIRMIDKVLYTHDPDFVKCPRMYQIQWFYHSIKMGYYFHKKWLIFSQNFKCELIECLQNGSPKGLGSNTYLYLNARFFGICICIWSQMKLNICNWSVYLKIFFKYNFLFAISLLPQFRKKIKIDMIHIHKWRDYIEVF